MTLELICYQATCDCGWVGPRRDNELEATADAADHARHERRVVAYYKAPATYAGDITV